MKDTKMTTAPKFVQEDLDLDYSQSKSQKLDISKALNLKEFSPAKNQLKTYLNQIITITSFEEVEPKLFKHDDRKTIKLIFNDKDGVERSVMTSAHYIVSQMLELKNRYSFGTPESRLESIVGKVSGVKYHGHLRSVYIADPNDNEEENIQQSVDSLG